MTLELVEVAVAGGGAAAAAAAAGGGQRWWCRQWRARRGPFSLRLDVRGWLLSSSSICRCRCGGMAPLRSERSMEPGPTPPPFPALKSEGWKFHPSTSTCAQGQTALLEYAPGLWWSLQLFSRRNDKPEQVAADTETYRHQQHCIVAGLLVSDAAGGRARTLSTLRRHSPVPSGSGSALAASEPAAPTNTPTPAAPVANALPDAHLGRQPPRSPKEPARRPRRAIAPAVAPRALSLGTIRIDGSQESPLLKAARGGVSQNNRDLS